MKKEEMKELIIETNSFEGIKSLSKNILKNLKLEQEKVVNELSDTLIEISLKTLIDWVKIVNQMWLNLDLKELIFFNEKQLYKIERQAKEIITFLKFIWLDELNIYNLIWWWKITKISINSNWSIKLNNIFRDDYHKLNKNVLNIINEENIKNKNWFFYSNEWMHWKWEDFAIKINDYLIISWDSYDKALVIDKKIEELLLSLSLIFKNKFDELIWNRDHLTKLITRKWLPILYKYFWKWHLCLIDIDNFKQINDTFWHEAWDKVLKTLASILKSELRKTDLIVRYWWEEFIFLVSEIEKEKVKKIIDRILNKIRNTKIKEIGNKNITISWWITKFNSYLKTDRLNKIIQITDSELYNVKKNWKNNINYVERKECENS